MNGLSILTRDQALFSLAAGKAKRKESVDVTKLKLFWMAVLANVKQLLKWAAVFVEDVI